MIDVLDEQRLFINYQVIIIVYNLFYIYFANNVYRMYTIGEKDRKKKKEENKTKQQPKNHKNKQNTCAAPRAVPP